MLFWKSGKEPRVRTSTGWSVEHIQDSNYREKFVNVPDIIEDWLVNYGGLSDKDVLEFGCGEGTMALAMALRKKTRRVVGVEISDVYKKCLEYARRQLGLCSLPSNLELHGIAPGADLTHMGRFDFVFSWSVFEHVSQEMLRDALQSVKATLKPNGLFFLQISPLFYSATGSHLTPWIPEPWAHLSMQEDLYYKQLMSAEQTSPEIRSQWSVYIPLDASRSRERAILWDTYTTLNRLTAPQLCRLAKDVGLEIVRDYRTRDEFPVPRHLAEIYDEDVLTTQQIVLLMLAR